MAQQKTIALVTISEVINDAFAEQLKSIFNDRIKIKKILLNDTENINCSNCDLILYSGKVLYDRVKEITPEGTKLIAVRRAINLKNISEIFRVEPGKEAIVVSNYKVTAIETIKLLQELGIDHINYHPYYPGVEYGSVDLAITPGGAHLVPADIKRIIDIGVKLIDVSTIIEIILELELSLNNTNYLIARYMKNLVELNKYSSQLNMVLEGMLSTSHDGIIALNEDNKIMFLNSMATKLLNIPLKKSIKRQIKEVIPDDNLLELITDNKNRINELITCNDKYIMVNKEELKQQSIFNAKIISLKDVTQIQRQEYEIRKKMRRKGFVAKYTFNDIIGISPELKKAVKISKKIADNDLTVLIKGESGTGKELFAQAIHNNSHRRNNPFIAVNFAALSDSLIESELFGYAEGAFTGARKGGKAGLFEQAHTGTIFIDEIGDASLALQARLLRVLQEKEVMRISGNSIIPVDVRVIAATNKNLDKLVEEGKFRRDLYFRLKVLYFTVPALRNRAEDIYYLVNYFLKEKNSSKNISDEVYRIFKKHNWSGNVRELENVCNYIINIVEEQLVKPHHLPEEFRNKMRENKMNYRVEKCESTIIVNKLKNSGMLKEYIIILRILKKARIQGSKLGRNRISEIVNKYGIDLTTDMVRYRLKKLEAEGLVNIRKTRQGTKITDKGIEVLAILGQLKGH